MIKKLPRRQFLVKAGIIGISSLATRHGFAQKQINHHVLGTHIDFLHKISKKTYSLKELLDTNLFNYYKTTLNNWQKSAYEAVGSDYYTCQSESLALFPIHLHHQTLGVLETVLLCFKKNENGDWIKLRSLSGFDLNALSAAADVLVHDNAQIDLGDYLLPFENTQKNVYGFGTKKGSVFLKTSIVENGSSTEIMIKEKETVLFHEVIKSSHNTDISV